MPEILNNVLTQNGFIPALQLGPVKNCKQISFVGLGQPFLVQLWKPDPRDPTGTPQEEGIVRSYPANGGDAFQGVSGVAFASALPGQPAQIYADLAYATDPLSLGQSITTASIGPNGQIVPVVTTSVLDQGSNGASVTITATSETTATVLVSSAGTTYDGSTNISVNFFLAILAQQSVTAATSFWLYEDGVSIGRVYLIADNGNNALPQVGVAFTSDTFTPTAGFHTYSIRASKTAGDTNPIARAGVGGLGATRPMYLRVLAS